MTHRLVPFFVVCAAALTPRPAWGQDGGPLVPDSIAVEGNRRLSRDNVLITTGLTPGRPVSYREVQLAIETLFGTGQYEDIRIEERTVAGRTLVVVVVRERPLLERWNVRGVEHVSERSARDVAHLPEGRPVDEARVRRARARLDSLYRARGFATAQVDVLRRYNADSTKVTLVYQVHEGRRVAIAQVVIDGNTHFSDAEIVGAMQSQPEGFFWFRDGEYDEEDLQVDLTDRLPHFYGEHGYIDFQVLSDSLVVDDATGKATVHIRVSEGEPYRVGAFEIVGNRKFSTEELERFYPFQGVTRTGLLGLGHEGGPYYFNQGWWDDATHAVQNQYYNSGYIYVRVGAEVNRGTDPQGNAVVDLRWVIEEGQPAVVNRIEIVGNDVTHEAVIRDAIVLLPGDVYRQDALIRSYQNISNLGFFEQLPPPDTRKANDQGDIDVVFHVVEKRTGNVNFGASVGQGTGLGGFLGLDEPNLFGRGKRGRFQWQFGENINDFQLSYTDPALRGSRLSGTLELHNARLRYAIGDLGQLKRRGATWRVGFPAFSDRYTRLFLTYEIDEQTFTASAANQAFANRFGCANCVRSTVGASVLRDTRIDLPFATAGAMVNLGVSQSGGPLGGRGNFRRVDLEGRWYAPLGEVGSDARGGGTRFVLAYSTRSGFVFGDAPFFQQLFFMGGTQFGIPLRGYNEFAITPLGFDPHASTGQASGPNSFGKAFFAMTAEIGARLSQIFYLSFFFDAGNLWAEPAQYDPTHLFRGAGIGLSVVSPFGPIGIDWAYGFDRTDAFGRPNPGWKFHFKLGNFF